jgi:hypothetical protein
VVACVTCAVGEVRALSAAADVVRWCGRHAYPGVAVVCRSRAANGDITVRI